MKRLLPALGLSLLCLAASAQLVVLSDPNQTYYPFHQSSFLVTRLGQLTIDSLLQHPDRYSFQPLRGPSTKLNNDSYQSDEKTEYWFRIQLNSRLRVPLYLRAELYNFTSTLVYEVANEQVEQQFDLEARCPYPLL